MDPENNICLYNFREDDHLTREVSALQKEKDELKRLLNHERQKNNELRMKNTLLINTVKMQVLAVESQKSSLASSMELHSRIGENFYGQ